MDEFVVHNTGYRLELGAGKERHEMPGREGDDVAEEVEHRT